MSDENKKLEKCESKTIVEEEEEEEEKTDYVFIYHDGNGQIHYDTVRIERMSDEELEYFFETRYSRDDLCVWLQLSHIKSAEMEYAKNKENLEEKITRIMNMDNARKLLLDEIKNEIGNSDECSAIEAMEDPLDLDDVNRILREYMFPYKTQKQLDNGNIVVKGK